MFLVRFILRLFFVLLFAYSFIVLAIAGPSGFVNEFPTTWKTLEQEFLGGEAPPPDQN